MPESKSISSGRVLYVLCKDIDKDGNGICVYNKQIIIVPGLIPEEEALIKCSYNKNNVWYGNLITLKKFSKHRKEAICKVFDICGGCSLQHIDYDFQSQLKNKSLLDNLHRIGKITKHPEVTINNSVNSLQYRNKTIIPIFQSTNDDFKAGYYKSKSHEIVDIEFCPILYEEINEVFLTIRNKLIEKSILANPDISRKGVLKNVVIKQAFYTKEILIGFITSYPAKHLYQEIAHYLVEEHCNIVSIINNIQPKNSNRLIGSINNVIYGRSYIIENFCDLIFHIGIESFFQINILEAEKAVKTIVDHITQEASPSRIIDAYSGIGTISLPIAKLDIPVVGIEANLEAYNFSISNMLLNNIGSAKYFHGNVEQYLNNILRDSDYLIVDPPRKGLSPDVLDLIIKKRPRYISYLSCNHSTLSRDLNFLCEDNTYFIYSISSFDFFPQTTHLETLVILRLLTS